MQNPCISQLKITITASGGDIGEVSVTVSGDGNIDQCLDAFRAALVAMSYSPKLAAKLTIAED